MHGYDYSFPCTFYSGCTLTLLLKGCALMLHFTAHIPYREYLHLYTTKPTKTRKAIIITIYALENLPETCGAGDPCPQMHLFKIGHQIQRWIKCKCLQKQWWRHLHALKKISSDLPELVKDNTWTDLKGKMRIGWNICISLRNLQHN